MKKELKKHLKFLIFSALISIPLILPYFRPGYFPTHDGEWAVIRLAEMYREVKDLQIPPRFSGYLNFEYGYPLFNFAYPGPYYFGVLFLLLKLGVVQSIKALFVISVIFSAYSMFLLSSSLWKSKLAGAMSAFLYIYAPYRVIDLFVRGSIGESLSFVIFPLILLGIKKLYDKEDKRINIFIVAILYTILILMHNIMAVLFSVFIFLIITASIIKRKINFTLKLIFSIIFSLCLSAFFWIPAIFEKNFILLSKIPIADRDLYFAHPLQLLIPKWGYGSPADVDGFGYQIGYAHIIVLFLTLLIAIKVGDKVSRTALFLVFSTIIISFLLFSQSSLIWSNLPLLSEINYPWTVLSIIMLLTSIVAGYLTTVGKKYILFSVLIAILSFASTFPYAKPQNFVGRGEGFYITNQATTTSSNELMPLWVKKFPVQSPNAKVESPSGKIDYLSTNSKQFSFLITSELPQPVIMNTIYYPGWKVFIDNKENKIDYNNPSGVIKVNVPAGIHKIRGSLTDTPIRFFSNLLSLASFLILIFIMIHNLKFQKIQR